MPRSNTFFLSNVIYVFPPCKYRNWANFLTTTPQRNTSYSMKKPVVVVCHFCCHGCDFFVCMLALSIPGIEFIVKMSRSTSHRIEYGKSRPKSKTRFPGFTI